MLVRTSCLDVGDLWLFTFEINGGRFDLPTKYSYLQLVLALFYLFRWIKCYICCWSDFRVNCWTLIPRFYFSYPLPQLFFLFNGFTSLQLLPIEKNIYLYLLFLTRRGQTPYSSLTLDRHCSAKRPIVRKQYYSMHLKKNYAFHNRPQHFRSSVADPYWIWFLRSCLYRDLKCRQSRGLLRSKDYPSHILKEPHISTPGCSLRSLLA